LTVLQGWLLPVILGTRFVTVGGAIANDVYSKNYHQAGTFGYTGVIRYDNLNELFALARESNQDYEYTLAWIDYLATRTQLGQGLFIRGKQPSPLPANPRDHRLGS